MLYICIYKTFKETAKVLFRGKFIALYDYVRNKILKSVS